MNVKLKVLTAGVLFFTGQALVAQEVKKDTASGKEKEIDEVVLVGYTRVKKNDYVGTAAKVNMKSIENKNVSTVSQALAGESAGVRVINSSGQPGSEPTVRIRGFGSVNGNRDPLYVVDGMPFSGNVSSINPEDIQDMVVLKDATATAIYGARGANGVVVITTKSGRGAKDYIQLESKVGINTRLLPMYDVISSPEEFISLAWSALYHQGLANGNANPSQYANNNLFGNKGIDPRYNMWNSTGANLIDPATGQVREGVTRKYTPENWAERAFKEGVRTEHNLSLGGGTARANYYAGIGYLKDEGYSINTGYERYTGRLNAGFKPKSWLSGTFNLGYAYAKTRNNGQTGDSSNVFWYTDNIPSIYPLYLRDNNGNLVSDPYFGGYQYDYGIGRGFGALTNGVADAVYNKRNSDRHEVNANFFLKADLFKGLSFETRIGGQYYNNSVDDLRNPYYGGSVGVKGAIYKNKYEMFTWNFLQMLRYSKKFGDHNIDAFAAHESTKWDYKALAAGKTGLVNPSIPELNNAITSEVPESYVNNYALESYFGQVNYDFMGKYLLSASIRRDGSSRFLRKKWDVFPSVGLGWVVSRENFLKDSKIVNNLKLKASYGFVGDQAGVGYYPGYNVYTTGNFMGQIGTPFDRGGYPDLTWEKAKMFQAGVDFTLFNRRLEGNVDYYRKLTDQLIFDKRLPPSTGNAIFKDNDGQLLNQGLEFSLVGHIIKKDDFFLDLGINGELPKSKLTRMPYDPSLGRRKIIDVSEGGIGRAEGYSIYDYYMPEWAGVNSATGAAQWYMNYVDTNNNGVYDDGVDTAIKSLYEYQTLNPGVAVSEAVTESFSKATSRFVGKSAIPDVRGAVNFSIGYKGFALGAQMLYSIGGYAYDSNYAGLMHNSKVGSNNWHTDIRNRWQNPGDITDVPRLTSGRTGDTNYNSRSTRFLTKADYFILNNINLSYTFSQDLLRDTGITGLSITLSADNLWLASRRKGFNPSVSETGQGSSYTYSPLTNFTVGVKVKF